MKKERFEVTRVVDNSGIVGLYVIDHETMTIPLVRKFRNGKLEEIRTEVLVAPWKEVPRVFPDRFYN